MVGTPAGTRAKRLPRRRNPTYDSGDGDKEMLMRGCITFLALLAVTQLWQANLSPAGAIEQLSIEELQTGRFLSVSFFGIGKYTSVSKETVEVQDDAGGGELKQFFFHVTPERTVFLSSCSGDVDVYSVARERMGTTIRAGVPTKVELECDSQETTFKHRSSTTGLVLMQAGKDELQFYASEFTVRRSESTIGYGGADDYLMTDWGGSSDAVLFSVRFGTEDKKTGLRTCRVTAAVALGAYGSTVHHADTGQTLGSFSMFDKSLSPDQEGAECTEHMPFFTSDRGPSAALQANDEQDEEQQAPPAKKPAWHTIPGSK